jgi:putative transposase
MTDNKFYPQRKSPRLQDYDYSSNGAYFVTICTHQRLHWFGQIHDGRMTLSSAGRVADQELTRIPDYWPGVELDCSVVMPNHIHAIIIITQPDCRDILLDVRTRDIRPSDNPTSHIPTLGQIVNGYKGGVTRLIHQTMQQPELTIWQARYHDHIIRNQKAHDTIRAYIRDNPACWAEDSLYSE